MVETAPPTTKAPYNPHPLDWTKKGKYTTDYTKAQNAAQTLARKVGKVKAITVATQGTHTEGKSCTVGAKTVKDG